MKDVSGKVAFVTGGGSGLGLAMARSFLAAGMKVAVADIEPAALEAAATELGRGRDDLITLEVDVTDRDAMEQAAAETVRAFGKVHIVCNNAGVVMSEYADRMTYRDWDWIINVNLYGVVNGVQSFLPHMKAQQEGGHFVNTASIAGIAAIPRMSAYAAAKFAVVGLSEALQRDLHPHDIGVSVLCPGVVRTNILVSERNRPDHLKREPSPQEVSLGADEAGREYLAWMEELLAGGIDPAPVGDMVLHAIRQNELYIFSHPEIKAYADARMAKMAAAFERWENYRKERSI